jgi:hypothetical protein
VSNKEVIVIDGKVAGERTRNIYIALAMARANDYNGKLIVHSEWPYYEFTPGPHSTGEEYYGA